MEGIERWKVEGSGRVREVRACYQPPDGAERDPYLRPEPGAGAAQ